MCFLQIKPTALEATEQCLNCPSDSVSIKKKWAQVQVKAVRKRERCDVDTLFSTHVNYDYRKL